MATRTVGVHEAKTQFSKLLREVEAGNEVVVTRGGAAVARLVAPEPRRDWRTSRGMSKGRIPLGDRWDEFEDLDAEIIQGFYGVAG